MKGAARLGGGGMNVAGGPAELMLLACVEAELGPNDC